MLFVLSSCQWGIELVLLGLLVSLLAILEQDAILAVAENSACTSCCADSVSSNGWRRHLR